MTNPWHVLARAEPLALVLDLDETGVPLSTTSDLLDRSLVLLLDALNAASIQVVVVARRPRPQLDEIRRQARHVWWHTSPGCAISWTREQLAGARVVAVGNDATLGAIDEREDFAIAVAPTRTHSNVLPSQGPVRVTGVTDIRAVLWWLVSLRSERARA